MEGLIAFVLMALFIGVVYLLVKAQQKSVQRQFQRIAHELGLNYSVPNQKWYSIEIFPELNGQLNQTYDIRIYMYSVGGGKHRKIYTAYDISINNPKGQQLEILKEGMIRKLGKAIGMQQDIEIRHEEFDNAFIIKANSNHFAKEILLDSELRRVLLHNLPLFNMNGKLSISGNAIHFESMMLLNTDKNGDKLLQSLKIGKALFKRWNAIN